MGLALIRHIQSSEYAVVGIDPSEKAREQARNLGLTVAESLSLDELFDCIFVCVPTPDDLFKVIRQ